MDLPCVPVALSFGSSRPPPQLVQNVKSQSSDSCGSIALTRPSPLAVAVAVAAAATQIREADEMEIANLHGNGELGV
ncbi:hypothetical protein BHE74_00053610 [Ensete ventricosum]|nr:hypothetical protein BHE74_00053610 [Ensete ventricosum]